MALAEARRRLMARPSPEHLAFVLTFSVFLAFLAGMLGSLGLGPRPALARHPAPGRDPAAEAARRTLGRRHASWR